jgi:hypothetical protein
MPVELVEIDWQGSVRVLGELDLPFPLRPDLHSLTAYHLAVVDDQHVALISPPVRHPRDQYHAYLALLDTRNGSIPYWGPIREHEEARPLPELSQQERTRLAIEQAVESEPDRAARLHEQFAAIVTELDPDSKQLPQAELHWVGVYEGPEVTVRVTETGHPVVLALTSYERVNWKVEAAPGVRIQKVVVVSVTPETTCSVPAGVAVERHGRGQRGGEGFYAHQRNDQNYLQAAAKLQELTDMKIATFQGQYHGGTFEIGTSNPSYRIQRLMVALKQLEKDALDGSLNRRVAELADFQFSAIYVPPAKPGEEIRRPFGNNKRIFADFTLKGPIHGTWTEWSGPEGDVVSDPAEPNVHYVVTRREVVRVRPDGRADAIASDAGLPEIRFRGFLTLDTKRRRLLVSSWGPRSKMSVYDLTQEKWSAWKSTRESDAAITYAAEEDAVYSINQMGGEETLRSVGKYTADGELVRTVTLVSPIPTAMRGPLGNGVQLRYHQGHLFVITSRLPASADPSNRPVEHLQIPWIYIVHFDSGETIYEGELKPHVPPRDLTDEQLQELWEQADLKDLDAVAWQFAAGHDRSTQFLARQFPPLDANYDDATVDRLLAKLDDANFAVRNDASEQLKMLGRKIEPRLERYLETETPSAEVKARLRELLESWNRNLPLTDREKRESLAILALQRIGTPSASDILRELANGPDWALRTVNAKAALGDKAAE